MIPEHAVAADCDAIVLDGVAVAELDVVAVAAGECVVVATDIAVVGCCRPKRL